ncbi:MAG: metal-dependent transcriptional regulator [Anaerolineaceae bacterium]|nr:metal-dependent transcriptional regulator [Anaerolineaceae bacterium]
MKILESAEDYLEMILVLKRKKGTVHSIDIAREMNFSKPSVSIAMKKLREDNLITINNHHEIDLTDAGKEIAERIYERHIVISKILMKIGVEETTAVKEACRIEHVISQDSFEKLKNTLRDSNYI